MSFGKILYTLRKGQNMSQEGLANELNTSRQAVSKWENDQGFPEMEKLLMMSNLFGVTVDYLLKGEDSHPKSGKEQGYYASKENIEGFLIYERNMVKAIALGVFLILMSGAPYLLFPKNPVLYAVMTVFLFVAGIASIFIACFKENKYKKITTEPLFIDNGYVIELQNRYHLLKKKYLSVLFGGIMLGFISIVIVTLLEDTFKFGLTGYHTIPLLLFAIGAFMIVYSSVMLEAFRVVTNNSEYIKNKKTDKKTLTYWHIIGIVFLCLVILAFIYIITDGEGHISQWIEKIISKL